MTEIGRLLQEKSFALAVRIVKLSQYLSARKQEYVLSKQVLRSGTSVGANLRESVFAQSTADFVSKLSIALKEASETQYWLDLLVATELITKRQFDSLKPEIDTLVSMLVTAVKSNKRKIGGF